MINYFDLKYKSQKHPVLKLYSGYVVTKFLHILLFLALLTFADPFSLHAQTKIDKSIKKGLENCYNFQWNNARNGFNSLIIQYPEDPRGYHYLAGTYLWLYLSNQEQTDFKKFIMYSDTALEKAKDKLEQNPHDSNLLYIIGTDYSFRAIAFSKAGKFIDAAWASKKSESYLSECLENDSTYFDAYLGLGLYNFAIGQISPAYRWALSLAGIKGDKITGVKYIKLAADKGNRSKIEGEYYLSEILTNYFNDYNSASRYLKSLVTKYPSNILFNYSFSVLKIKQRQLSLAKKVLRNILSEHNLNFVQIISYSNLLMGDVFFKENKFDSAKVYYKNFIGTTLSKDYEGIANFRLGVCYEITGQRDTAVKYYNLSGNGNASIDDDIYAKRKGEQYLKHPLTREEFALIKDNNLIESGKYKTANDSLQLLLKGINDVQLKAEVRLRLSEATYNLGDYQDSYDFAIAAKDSTNPEETWIAPYACFYAARAQEKLGNEKEVKLLIEQAKGFSDYDYQNKLQNMLYVLGLKS